MNLFYSMLLFNELEPNDFNSFYISVFIFETIRYLLHKNISFSKLYNYIYLIFGKINLNLRKTLKI